MESTHDFAEDDPEDFGRRIVVVSQPAARRANINTPEKREIGFGFFGVGHDGEVTEADRLDISVRASGLFSFRNFGGNSLAQITSVDLARSCKRSPEYCTHELTPPFTQKHKLELEMPARRSVTSFMPSRTACKNVSMQAFPKSDTMRRATETLPFGKILMFENRQLWFDVPSPTKALGQEENGNCGSLPAASCPGLISHFEREHAGIDILAHGHQGLTDEQEFVRGNLAALEPIAHSGRPHAHGGGGGGGSTQGFDDGFDCDQHAP